MKIITLTPNPAIDLSARVDRVVPFAKLRCSTAQRDPGGGGINVARVLRRFGLDPLAIFTSGGPTGLLLQRLVAAEQVASEVVAIAGDTREDISIFEETSEQQFRFVMPGPVMQPAEQSAFAEALERVSDGADFVVASGSLPPGAPEDYYAAMSRRAKAAGALFILDTAGAALDNAMKEGVHLIKPSLRELRELTHQSLPDEASWIAAARSIIARGGSETVALSLGERGAIFVTRDQSLRAHAPKVKAVSTVGAGDSFLGGMLAARARGDDWKAALRSAVAAGTAALLSPGTDLCRPGDAKALEASIEVLELT